ncbi:unnamed protein product [Moneuplotes crassus]|uniref:Uncharacterized protein n=1 Tax=Euplotes crassus TaxID=5936 RepID=A0AAD2D3U6_EUPCR|nr:unnamed protein product [Moneuplotes crassus]
MEQNLLGYMAGSVHKYLDYRKLILSQLFFIFVRSIVFLNIFWSFHFSKFCSEEEIYYHSESEYENDSGIYSQVLDYGEAETQPDTEESSSSEQEDGDNYDSDMEFSSQSDQPQENSEESD